MFPSWTIHLINIKRHSLALLRALRHDFAFVKLILILNNHREYMKTVNNTMLQWDVVTGVSNGNGHLCFEKVI